MKQCLVCGETIKGNRLYCNKRCMHWDIKNFNGHLGFLAVDGDISKLPNMIQESINKV